MIPAGAIRKRAIIRQFLEAGAVSEETARTPEEAGVFRGLGIKFDQLVERGRSGPLCWRTVLRGPVQKRLKKGGASAGSASLFSLCRYSPAPQSFPAPGPDFYGIQGMDRML